MHRIAETQGPQSEVVGRVKHLETLLCSGLLPRRGFCPAKTRLHMRNLGTPLLTNCGHEAPSSKSWWTESLETCGVFTALSAPKPPIGKNVSNPRRSDGVMPPRQGPCEHRAFPAGSVS